MNKKFKVEITEKEMNEIYVDRAFINTSNASSDFMKIVKAHGDRIALKTACDLTGVIEFNGRLYA